MGHLVSQQVTAGGPSRQKPMIVTKIRSFSCEKNAKCCVKAKIKVTLKFKSFTSQPALISGRLLFCIAIGDWRWFFLRRMLKAMVEKAHKEALHDKVA